MGSYVGRTAALGVLGRLLWFTCPYVGEAAGLDELLARTPPQRCFFGHHHTRLEAVVAGVSCPGLNKSPHPGSLPAVEMSGAQRGWRILGEWPTTPTASAKAAKPRKPEREPQRSPPSAAIEPDDDLDARVDGLAEQDLPLARHLKAQHDQARALRLFPNDRELLTCPHCGLAEDVLSDGRLITSYEVGEADTGLRFIEPESDDGPFTCPGCCGEAQPGEASPPARPTPHEVFERTVRASLWQWRFLDL